MACTPQIGSSVRAKRQWILGVCDESMRLQCEELTTTKTLRFRPHPMGRWGLPAISVLRAVVDAHTSTSVSRLDLAGKTHRRCYRFGGYRSLGCPGFVLSRAVEGFLLAGIFACWERLDWRRLFTVCLPAECLEVSFSEPLCRNGNLFVLPPELARM